MTIIKQRGVASSRHQKNLRGYINDDRKVLLRDSQNMEECHDLRRWAAHMERTRVMFGHDKASRKGADGKPAKNTILYHQILGFNPDECDINGGKLSPEDCMRYAKEYAKTYYPNQQIVFALHNEYCKDDRTHRYAVHMVINRSDLATGKRLAEGRGDAAKRTRAKRIRTMDEAWDLKQVQEGKRNSAVHKKQPSKIERAIEARGGRSYKTNLRELCQLAAERTQDVFSYRELLESWGVDTEFRKGRMYVTDRDNSRYSFSVKRLGADLGVAGPSESANTVPKEVTTLRNSYLSELRQAYLDYRKAAHTMTGTELSSFPKLKLPRPPKGLSDDPEVRRTILAYWRGADELRVELASNVLFARNKASRGSTSGSVQQRNHGSSDRSDRSTGRSGER